MKGKQLIPEIVNETKIRYLDGLRCVSVLIVVLGHLNSYYFGNRIIDKVTGSGGLGVIFFL